MEGTFSFLLLRIIVMLFLSFKRKTVFYFSSCLLRPNWHRTRAYVKHRQRQQINQKGYQNRPNDI